jgi:DNA-binding helix-hairpin-helix protein with protein kinase domain
MGPYLKPLFDRAFIDGLHDPSKRPTADEWESALVKTVDLIQPCQNKDCDQKWYVFNGKTKPVCPYCGTPYKGKLPILNLYSSRKAELSGQMITGLWCGAVSHYMHGTSTD